MSAQIIPFPRPVDVEPAHDRYVLLLRAFAEAPSPKLAAELEEAFSTFYRAYVGSADGLAGALADLRAKMSKAMAQRGVA